MRWAVTLAVVASLLAAPGAAQEFRRSVNDRPWGYAVVPDPTGAAPTPMVERFEVRPGDCGSQPGWDDCATDRERSELSERLERAAAGTTRWYGWWLYLSPDFANVHPTKTALGQFHQEDSHPVWMFQNDRGGLWLDDQSTGRSRHYYPLIADEDLRGRWHRIEVQARWSREPDGFLRVWVDGERKVDHAGPTMTAQTVYMKYGVYRSFLSRYRAATGVPDVPAQTAYYAAVCRAATREGLNP